MFIIPSARRTWSTSNLVFYITWQTFFKILENTLCDKLTSCNCFHIQFMHVMKMCLPGPFFTCSLYMSVACFLYPTFTWIGPCSTCTEI